MTNTSTGRLHSSLLFLIQNRKFGCRLPIGQTALCILSLVALLITTESASASSPEKVEKPDPIMELVDQAIEVNKHRYLDLNQNRPWEILHGLLALRNDYYIKDGERMVRAIDWISTEATYKGKRWFEATPHGARAHPYNGTPYDFEGHVNQTLAILSMCDLPRTHKFKLADGRIVTMDDMIRHAQSTVNRRDEVSWTLWFLTHYIDQDAQWVASDGQTWSMEALVKMQVQSPPYNAPCGGCHGLFALAYARNSYLQKHGQLRGTYLEADQKIQQFVAAAKNMQNRDGSFATQFFKARGFSNNFNERIKSSGHMLEWLMIALPMRQLKEEWVQRGVQRLALDLIQNASQPADCGSLYHSLNALVMYKQRFEPNYTPGVPVQVAAAQQKEAELKALAEKKAEEEKQAIVAEVQPAPETAIVITSEPAVTEVVQNNQPTTETPVANSPPADADSELEFAPPIPLEAIADVASPEPQNDAAPSEQPAIEHGVRKQQFPLEAPRASGRVADNNSDGESQRSLPVLLFTKPRFTKSAKPPESAPDVEVIPIHEFLQRGFQLPKLKSRSQTQTADSDTSESIIR